MKILIAVLFIRFVIELVVNNKENSEAGENKMVMHNVRHPAEYELR